MMKKPVKISAVAGITLFVLAALFAISLLSVLFDYGTMSPVHDTFFLNFGKMISGVYGFSSVLIPLFFIVAGIECFTSNWSVRKGFVLLGSVVPFFTVYFCEKVCRKIIETSSENELSVKLFAALVIGVLAVAAEYVLLSIIGKFFVKEETEEESEEKIEEKPVENEAVIEKETVNFAAENEPAVSEEIFEEETVNEVPFDADADETEAAHPQFSPATGSFEPNPFDHVFDSVESSQMEEEQEPHYYENPEPIEYTEEKIADDAENFEEAAEEIADAEIDFDPEKLEAEEYEEPVEINEEEKDFLEEEVKVDNTDEIDIISEFENNAAIETEHLDDTIEVDPAFFGLDLNAETEAESEEEDVFAMMDQDAAREPMLDNSELFENDITLEDPTIQEGVSEDLPDDIYDEELHAYEFDPTAKPVVDANGNPYEEESIPIDTDEIKLEDIPVEIQNAIKNTSGSTQSSLEKTVFGDAPVAVNEKGEPAVQPKKKPKLRMSNYKVPTDLLEEYENGEYWVVDPETKQKAEDLKQTLAEFNIDVEVTGICKGPVVTMFEVLPAPGVNVNRIRTLQDNIALRLAATSVRIVSPIPGKSAVGIEIPNKGRAIVSFREIMEQKNPAFEKMAIPVILGKDISGEPQLIDLAKTPHLLIAGSTGAGKSVCVNSLILSILYKRSPQQVKLILVDPKVVELKLYNDIPHLLTPVITEPKKALQSLQYCLCEMERRYALLDGMGVRDIANYNKRIVERNIATEKLPYIVVIIDEFADLMATTGRELESNVARLAAMSRAVGIHLVLATQRPSVNVITGLIKANIPSRIAFMVASRTDSNIIIDQIGAEKLLGKGDMLYASATDPFPCRIQGTLVVDDEVERVVEYVKQYGEPEYIDDEIFVDDEDDEGGANPGLFSDGDDPLYDQALQIVIQAGKASASYIQRRLKIGYNRAARLVEEMEERGIVGPANGSKPREIIHTPN